MSIINYCSNINVSVYLKQNTWSHNSIIQDGKIKSDGMIISKNLDLTHFDDRSKLASFIKKNDVETKTLKVKPHLPSIGYYDIIIGYFGIDPSWGLNRSIYKVSYFEESPIFRNIYDNDNYNLSINKNISIEKDVFVGKNITAFNTYVPSDINLKKNIVNITNGLEIINKIRPVKFKWKKNNKESIGFIAQELEEILPNLVIDSDNGKTIKQDKLIPYIVDSIKNINDRLKKYE